MLGKYRVLTITHRETTLDQLSHFVIKSDTPEILLHQLKDDFGLDELMYLATCNRIMFLFHSDQAFSQEFVLQFFSKINPDMPNEVKNNLPQLVRQYQGKDAIDHLFSVAASTDSLGDWRTRNITPTSPSL